MRPGYLIKTVNGEKVETWQDVTRRPRQAGQATNTVSVVRRKRKELAPKPSGRHLEWQIRHIRLEPEQTTIKENGQRVFQSDLSRATWFNLSMDKRYTATTKWWT